jgi:hypothetical protein
MDDCFGGCALDGSVLFRSRSAKNPRLPSAALGRPWEDRTAHNAPESRHLREEARTQVKDLHGFDYTAPAEFL